MWLLPFVPLALVGLSIPEIRESLFTTPAGITCVLFFIALGFTLKYNDR